jgi:hypothetical protein
MARPWRISTFMALARRAGYRLSMNTPPGLDVETLGQLAGDRLSGELNSASSVGGESATMARIRALFEQINALHGELLDAVQHLSDTADFEGAEVGLAPQTYISRRLNIAPKMAARWVHTARNLSTHAPNAKAALRRGQLSLEVAATIGRTCAQIARDVSLARRRNPEVVFTDLAGVAFEPVSKAEEVMLSRKLDGDIRDDGIEKISAAIRDHMCADQARERRARREGDRHVHLSQLFDGMWRLDGLLDEVTGLRLRTLLHAASKPPADTDERSPSQRDHDALGVLLTCCQQGMDTDDEQVFQAAGRRSPHIRFTANADAMALRPEGVVPVRTDADWEQLPAITDLGSYLSPGAARELACHASARLLGYGGANREALFGGRVRRFPTDLQFDAVIARDQHCRYPGCDMPARCLEIHHRIAWIDGGPTDVPNLVGICTRHHHGMEAQGLTLIRGPGGVDDLVPYREALQQFRSQQNNSPP